MWDGHSLVLRADGGGRIGICLNGSHFTELRADENGRASLAFPFSPSGQASLSVQASVLQASDKAPSQVFSIRIGTPGISPDSEQATRPPDLDPIGVCVPANVQPMAAEVAIIIPVYNAIDATRRCLDSVLANSSGRCRLIVIDDASTDTAVAPMLAGYRGIPGVEIYSNPHNLGFTATVNRGMSLAGQADVVLLNADTEVASQWLTGLRRAAYASADTATATAVSDNAGAFSVPELERENPLPQQWTFAQAARAHWQGAGHAYPQLPTGNGFCMYIRRSSLNQLGLFDVDAFPQGYGEENDFCQRACAVGYRHVIAGNVLVRHARSQSFGTERREALGRAGMQVLRDRWPNYESDVGRQLFSFERLVLDWRVRRIHASAASHMPQPRLLRFCSLAEIAPMSGYDIHMLETTEDRLSLNDTSIGDGKSPGPLEWDLDRIPDLFEKYAYELLEIGQDMDSGLAKRLHDHGTRLGIPVLALAAGELATLAQREAARHSLNRFGRVTR
ncbi:glycosyltransferase family 2 protein [Dokdonella sp.]|uniref:glycosyltransferase family 2 protein n=1 Tax=Dokdonella sp. TaxID=2291710 RepID=UPI003C38B5CE